jgi:hypothetical protein
VHLSSRGLVQTSQKFFNYVSIFFVKWLLYIIKHPLKTVFFILKLYITLLLLLLCLTASFSTFAHEVPARETGNPTITGPLMSPIDIRGQPWSNVKTAVESGIAAGNMLNVVCSVTSSTPISKVFNCQMINGFSNRPRTFNITATASGPISYSCPPNGYSDHTVLTDDTCNTPTGDHGNTDPDPEPEPDLPSINCTSLAGNPADFASFFSSERLTADQLNSSKCSNNVGSNGKSKNSCHIVNGAGWTGQPVFQDGIETGINYTSINGTFSGFGCNADGDASDSNESCTAIDTGRIKKVDCPDGTSMTVNWGDYMDTKEAFLNQRASVQNDLNTVNGRVDNLESTQVTTDDVVLSLSNNESFKDSVKGQNGEACTVERMQNGVGGTFINCDGSQSNIWDGQIGAKGEVGATGQDGQDGDSCTAIARTDGVNIVCKSSTQFLASGKNGDTGLDGETCTTTPNGKGGSVITCGSSVSEIEGVDQGGIIDALTAQTGVIQGGLTYDGDIPNSDFANSDELNIALGIPNDYEVRNYGTVIEASVNKMKTSPVFEAVDGFFDVTFTGSCPTYSANVPFLNTSIVFDHWCRPVMTNIWPIISSILMFGFSFMAFRVAIL